VSGGCLCVGWLSVCWVVVVCLCIDIQAPLQAPPGGDALKTLTLTLKINPNLKNPKVSPGVFPEHPVFFPSPGTLKAETLNPKNPSSNHNNRKLSFS
jgi:hypothetical protein